METRTVTFEPLPAVDVVEAERRLRERFAQGEPASLIDDFIRLVERGKN